MTLPSPREPADTFGLDKKPAAPVEKKPAPEVLEHKPETWRPYDRPGFEVNGDGQLRTVPETKAGAAIRVTDLGEEKFCPDCCTWWPHDRAFFYGNNRGGYTHNCRTCRLDGDRVRRGVADRRVPVPEVFGVSLRGAP